MHIIKLFIFICVLVSTNHAIAQNADFEWEILNRFSPFEVYKNPDVTFKEYSPKTGENLFDWHERLYNQAKSRNMPLSPYVFTSPWDEKKQQYKKEILDFIQYEDSPHKQPKIKVSVELKSDINSDCEWYRGKQLLIKKSCKQPIQIDIPLSGTTLEVLVFNLKERKILEIKPEHKVIVALGDSYGSGEGNPDKPAKWRKKNPPRNSFNWLLNKVQRYTSNNTEYFEQSYLIEEAEWMDNSCHRSFFSYKTFLALNYASQNPDTFVSYLHYDCSGAEIFDGLLTRQEIGTFFKYFKKYNKQSQINSAIQALCKKDERDQSHYREIKARQEYETTRKKYLRAKKYNYKLAPHAECLEGKLREPDALLISIGGNDIGFATIIRYYIVPAYYRLQTLADKKLRGEFCPTYKIEGDEESCAKKKRKKYDIGDLITQIPDKMEFLISRLETDLKIERDKIFIPAYPQPLLKKKLTVTVDNFCKNPIIDDEVFCGKPSNNNDNQWSSFRSILGYAGGKAYNLTWHEANCAYQQINDFRDVYGTFLSASGVNYVNKTRDSYIGHAWCQGEKGLLPNSKSKTWGPWEWDPYKPISSNDENRFIRTANDSFLTQANNNGFIDRTLGSFHPNLLGHIKIAEDLKIDFSIMMNK